VCGVQSVLSQYFSVSTRRKSEIWELMKGLRNRLQDRGLGRSKRGKIGGVIPGQNPGS